MCIQLCTRLSLGTRLVELEDIQIQRAMAKFYAKMRVGKASAIGMLAEYTVAIGCGLSCKQLLSQQPLDNNFFHSSHTVSCAHDQDFV